jgi:LPS-assembly protein
MQIKNKILFFLFLLNIFLLNFNINAEEFDITAKEIIIDKENQIIKGIGSVKAVDSEGKIINGNKITYEKTKEFLLIEGQVEISDVDGNILKTNKATYDKFKEIIITYDNTKILLNEGYEVISKNILYDATKRIITSDNASTFTDTEGNIIKVSMFSYDINNNLFSSVGEIDIIDIKKNKYFFKELHVNTKTREMVGSDVSVVLDQKTFGVSDKSDPRFVSNSAVILKDSTSLSKGVFTICKKRDGKCPPWSLKAKKISHDKIKKTIYYEHATLKIYDIPVFYFPRFFHPDPTVKRQSGFLAPFFTHTTSLGTGFGLPYFWAINKDKDLTFTPKIYNDENALLFNEYRQAFKNGFLTLDTSFSEGYKNTTTTKTGGSRNHIFANLDLNFTENESYNSNLFVKFQRTSNDTYFRAHDVNTALVDQEKTTMENEINYSFSTDDLYLDINTSIYENLREKKKSDRYEFILPNIIFGKTFFTEKFGTFDLRSNALYTNYNTNTHEGLLTNDIIWSPMKTVTKTGFVNTVEGMIRNRNYESKASSNYKNDHTINEFSGVISHKTSLPLKKDGVGFSNLFSPNLMIRYAPGHMLNLSGKDTFLDYSNLYSLNKTSEIEDGLSAVLGFDFKTNEKVAGKNDREKLAVSLGQVFNNERNNDMPSKSSLDQRMSDIVGKVDYNFAEIGKINYKFSLDHNLNDLNYNEVSTKLNFGNVEFNLDYLEQQNHIGREHYASSGVTLNFDDNNKLSFSTKKNFKTESTELYDLSYQYAIDCLTAGILYRREFYQDTDDLEPKDSLMFTITFVPFTSVTAPLKQ